MDALVILVGITADHRKRIHVRDYFERETPFRVFAPALPRRAGLRVSAAWLLAHLGAVGLGGYDRVHFLNYISGGFLFRLIGPRLSFITVGRVVYDRAPIQELVPASLIERYGRLTVLVGEGKTATDLAEPWIHDLPFPAFGSEQGLIIETEPSARAGRLGLTHASPPADAWSATRLLPGAADVIRLPLSHDEVYDSPAFLSEARRFISSGRFGGSEQGTDHRGRAP